MIRAPRAWSRKLDISSDPSERFLYSPLMRPSQLQVTSGTAYWAFIGRTTSRSLPKYISAYCAVVGSDTTGAHAAEVALARTNTPPNKANQTLTKIVAAAMNQAGADQDFELSVGVKRNATAFTTVIEAGVYLWAGIRCALDTTQPNLHAITRDHGRGFTLTTAASGALTGAGPWTGVLTSTTAGANGVAIDLVVEFD